jgi:hypothetical protein
VSAIFGANQALYEHSPGQSKEKKMDLSSPSIAENVRASWSGKVESSLSAVSWAAIFGGAAVAAAMSLILLALGAGLGLTSVSPWSGKGLSAQTIGIATVLWLVIMQIISSAMGGYVSGRLRTKWTDIHTDEVYFRDTAHGFLTWAVATVASAAFLGTAAASLVGVAGDVATKAAGAAAVVATAAGAGAATQATGNEGGADSTRYFVDSMLRPAPVSSSQSQNTGASIPGNPIAPSAASDTTSAGAIGSAATPATQTAATNGQPRGNSAALRGEVTTILAKALADGSLSPGDRTYLVQVVAANSGISQADAEKRVNDAFAQAQAAKQKALQVADDARHTAAALAFWSFFALLVGAFSGSFAGTIGGRQRDLVRPAQHAIA